jgi:FtsH-binding integral membrane protein
MSQEEVDSGLRSYMLRVYNYMAMGVALTGALILFLTTDAGRPLLAIADEFRFMLLIGLLGMGFLAGKVLTMRSTGAAHAFYWGYCALWGLIIAPMVTAYLSLDPTMVARAFLITTGMFAGMSLIGYTTKKDLSGMGRFFMMATIGLLIAMVVNFFFVESSMLALGISCLVVLVFAGMTAYETQMIKNMYMDNLGDDQITKFALFGALMLYGSFVTMFIHILSILNILNSD